FFQEEDGIRDSSVTGVQTCALPISCSSLQPCKNVDPCQQDEERNPGPAIVAFRLQRHQYPQAHYRPHERPSCVADVKLNGPHIRSEERRVGKDCTSRWRTKHSKKRK